MGGGMSRAEARAIWLKHVVDPDTVPPPQLARARNSLIKKMHPDVGGDVEDAKLINAAYDVLKASPLDEAARQRQEQEQRERDEKRQQWEQHQRDYNEQRERERRYQEWMEKRAARRRADALAEAQHQAQESAAQPEAEKPKPQCQADVQRQRRWRIAKRCYALVIRSWRRCDSD